MRPAPRTFAHPAGLHNQTPRRVVFGPGSVAGLRDEVARLGASRALVVTTPGRTEMGDRLAGDIGDACAGLLPEAVSQVPIELAHRGRDKAESMGADCLVAVGGGAATGLCKGIAYESGLPIIAVPTTYSGSEMTGYCGMTIDGVKRMHESQSMRVSTVVYDAELSVGLPPAVSAASALNALAHCIDVVPLSSVSPLIVPAALEGARVITSTLPRLLAEPSSIWARNEMLYGAYLGGAALTGGFALQHAVAHMLGGSFGVDHGIAHAVVLPYVTAVLVERAPAPLARVAEAVGTDDLPGFVWDLVHDAGLPTTLREVGLDDADRARAIEISVSADDHSNDAFLHPDTHDQNREGNPVPVRGDVVAEIIDAAAAGSRPGAPS